jgi:hypothetical protein
MASLQPQTNVNAKEYFFVTNPVGAEGIQFMGNPRTAILNISGILQTPTGDILNDSYWAKFPAISGYIDMAPGGGQRITATNSQLFYNGEPLANGGNVADWSFFPVDSGYIDFSGPAQRLTATNASLVYNGVPLTTGQGENWSLYPAQQSVNMSQYNLDNVLTVNTQRIGVSTGADLGISAPGNVNISSNNKIVNTPYNEFNVKVGSVSSQIYPNLVDISTLDGEGPYGQINLTANAGLLGVNGAVYITANGGKDPTGSTAYGGNITIQANTPILTTGVTFSSAVKISAASVLSYAGAVPTIASTTGTNYIFGNTGVSITSDVVGPILPPSPLTVYIYGAAGTSIPSNTTIGRTGGLFCSDITPYSDTYTTSDLNIKGRGTNRFILEPLIGNVNLSNVKTIDGNIFVKVPPYGVTTVPGLEITGLTKINGLPYVDPQAWSTQPAESNIDMSGYSITRCNNVQTDDINGLPYIQTEFWASTPALSNVNISGNSITNVNNIQATTVNGFPYPPVQVYVNVATEILYEWFAGLMIYRGSSATTFNFTSLINGPRFNCRFINGNLSGLPMQVYVNGALLGTANLYTNYTLSLAPGGQWYLYG